MNLRTCQGEMGEQVRPYRARASGEVVPRRRVAVSRPDDLVPAIDTVEFDAARSSMLSALVSILPFNSKMLQDPSSGGCALERAVDRVSGRTLPASDAIQQLAFVPPSDIST